MAARLAFSPEQRLLQCGTPAGHLGAGCHNMVSLCSSYLKFRVGRKVSFSRCTSTRLSQVFCRISADEANIEKASFSENSFAMPAAISSNRSAAH